MNLGHEGFGIASPQDLLNLNKALEAGYATSPETQVGGGALRVESLESSLKVLTYTDQHVKFWKRIPKKNAYSTVEEYNQLISYGSDTGGFYGEGELPDADDSNYQRRAAFVKFVGTTRSVTHPMTLVTPAHGDVIALENKNGIMKILKTLEWGLFWGDSKLGKGGTEYVEFDGLFNQIDPENTIDLKGEHLTEQHLNWGAQMIVENYGFPTDLFLPYEVLGQFQNEFLPKERIVLPSQNGMTAGAAIEQFNTHAGTIRLEPDIFLRKTEPLKQSATHPQAPAAPTTINAEEATEAGDFIKSGGAGTYTYYVTAANRHGESAPSPAAAFAMVDASKGVKITANVASSQHPVEYYNVYRTEKDGSKAYRIARVAAKQDGSLEWVDTNYIMPNTYTAFMGEMDENVIAFKKLSDLMKMDLAILAPAYRWMILLYGVPILYAPRKFMKFINIKVDFSKPLSQI